MRRLAVLSIAAVVAVTMTACGSSAKTNTGPAPSTVPDGSHPTGTVGIPNTGNPTKPVMLTESGSSLLFPYLQQLVAGLTQAYPNIALAPAAGGSGKGISDAIAGTSKLGGTDAYLSPAQAAENKTLAQIPIVVSAQAINYNLPGVTGLKLNGDVLARIYQGKVTKWNDPAISTLNAGTTLPATAIVPVRRSDSSGDTFLFSSFLTATNQAWSSGPSMGTTVPWPNVTGELTASGNPGMVQTCATTPGCIAYVGVSAEAAAQTAHLGEASLKNAAGSFTTPTPDAIKAAVAAGSGKVADNLQANLINGDGAQSYPIVNFEYLVVNTSQPDADTAEALRTFFAYAIDPTKGATDANLAKANFVALPDAVLAKVKAAVAKIGG